MCANYCNLAAHVICNQKEKLGLLPSHYNNQAEKTLEKGQKGGLELPKGALNAKKYVGSGSTQNTWQIRRVEVKILNCRVPCLLNCPLISIGV